MGIWRGLSRVIWGFGVNYLGLFFPLPGIFWGIMITITDLVTPPATATSIIIAGVPAAQSGALIFCSKGATTSTNPPRELLRCYLAPLVSVRLCQCRTRSDADSGTGSKQPSFPFPFSFLFFLFLFFFLFVRRVHHFHSLNWSLLLSQAFTHSSTATS